jgi:hypothetical protein
MAKTQDSPNKIWQTVRDANHDNYEMHSDVVYFVAMNQTQS